MNRARRKKTALTTIALSFTIAIVTIGLFNSAFAWTKDEQLTTDDSWDTCPSVMQTRNGTVWVAWSSDRFASYDLFYKTYNGSSWSDPARITWRTYLEDDPSIIETRDGRIWVVYQCDKTGNYDLYYKTSSNGGLSWSSALQFTDDLRDDTAPSIIQNVDGTIWVVWQRSIAAGNDDVFYKTSSNNGVSWSAETPLIENPGWDKSPSITWTHDGTVWVVWCFYNTTEHHYDLHYKTYNGSSWSAETRITTDTAWDMTPSVIQSVDGIMWVFWSKELEIYYKTYNMSAMTWSSDTLLTKSSGDDANPSATSTNDRKIWVVLESTRSDFDIYYKISDEILQVHDVAITDITVRAPPGFRATWVPRGIPLYVDITLENQGTFNETFDASVYADNNVGDVHIDLGTESVFLTAGANTTLTFTWDTTNTPFGTYYIGAEATIVSGEYDTLDNVIMANSRIGGICVPIQQLHVNILASLAPVGLTTLALVLLGIAAIGFFKLLMSPRLRRMASSKAPPAKYAKQCDLPPPTQTILRQDV